MEHSPNRLLGPRRPQQRGLTVLWIIVFFILMLSFGAIAVEMAWLRVNQTRAQTAAEAASLAAIAVLNEGRHQALSESIEMAGANPGAEGPVILTGTSDNTGGDLIFGRWDSANRAFEHALLAPDAVEVTVRLTEHHANGPVPLMFGGLMGFNHSNVSARAIAHRSPKMPVPTALWVLERLQPKAIFLQNASQLSVNGAVGIQSTSSRALTIQTGGLLRATLINIQGGIAVDSDNAVYGMLDEEPDIPHVPPLPHFNLNSLPTHPTVVDTPGVHNLPPGYYPYGLVASTGAYVLEDGVFLFGGAGIELTGLAKLTSHDAIIFLAAGTRFQAAGPTVAIKLTGAAEINGIENSHLIVLAAVPGSEPEILLADVRIWIRGGVYLPGSTLEASDTIMSCTQMVLDSIALELGSTITVGVVEPHPIDLLLVR